MVFNPNRPIASELLSDSQPLLLSNNQALDTSFGVDHYPFSNATGNNGFHNKVTTPVFVDSPPTGLPPVTTSDPIFYAFQDTANLGVLHYSRGPSDAVPTPLTNLYSTSTPLSVVNGGSTTVLDFTGIALCHAVLTYSFRGFAPLVYQWLIRYETALTPAVLPIYFTPVVSFTPQFSGAVLSLVNTTGSGVSDLYWTLNLLRIQV